MESDIWFSDLTQCEPTDAISRNKQRGTWTAVDYGLDDRKGTMLFGLSQLDPPPLTLHLGAKGWYQIRLGIYYGGGPGFVEDRVLCAKLSQDAAFGRFCRDPYQAKDGSYPERELGWGEIAEVFWKCADLTDQDLIIARPAKGVIAEKESNLAYVRLTPMDDVAMQAWQSQQPRDDTKRLIANYDGNNFRYWGVTTPEDLRAEFECLRESDFAIALQAMAYSSVTFYPSRVGELMPRLARHGHGEPLHRCVANGCNPLAEAIKAAHDCGVKLFPQNRLIGIQLPPDHLDDGGPLIRNHPEWRCTYADGEPIHHLSLAFPDVRDFHVRLMREWVADYQADGVNVLFSRSYPFAYYEQPVCDAFWEIHHEDMRRVPPDDERVQRARASFVTQFLRETRAMLDEVGAEQGRYIPNCYTVPVNGFVSEETWQDDFHDMHKSASASALAECLFRGLDVPTWIQEGLVDYLVVHLHVLHKNDGAEFQGTVREFTRLAQGTKTRVYMDIYPRRMPPAQYRKVAMSYYAAGADGLALWDCDGRRCRASEWAFAKRLGHRLDLPGWEGIGDDYYRKVPIRRLNGYPLGRELSSPTDG